MHRVLLVDDDIELCELLSDYLSSEDFAVTAVHDGATALAQALAECYDVMILDVMLPKLNGFDTLRALRQQSRLPVLMLTARGESVDRIVGLEIGADDYLPKPCNPREVVARLRAILRRSQGPEPFSSPSAALTIDDVELRPAERSAWCRDRALDLTSVEFSLLEQLLRAAGQVVSKAALSEQALRRKLGRFDRSVDVHISHLRKKLGSDRHGRARIKTVRGVGYLYVLVQPPDGKSGRGA